MAAESPDHHEAAWCLFHLGRFDEALARLEQYLDADPGATAALTDRATIGFIAHEGGGEWSAVLAGAIFTAAADEFSTAHAKELCALAPQWLHLGLATAGTLNTMLTVVGEAVALAARH